RNFAHSANRIGAGNVIVVADRCVPRAAAIGQCERLTAGQTVIVLLASSGGDAGFLDLYGRNRELQALEQNRRRVLDDVVGTVLADQIGAEIRKRKIVEAIDVGLRDGVGLDQLQRRVVFAGEQCAPSAALEAAIDIALREFAAVGIGAVIDIDAVLQFVDGFQ